MHLSPRTRAALGAVAVLASAPILANALPAAAQTPTPGKPDASLAPAGTYKLDPRHTGVIVRVSHINYSNSVFRFDTADGTLTWDPAQPEKNALTATVQTASITSNVPNFATELTGDKYMKSKTFPVATFKSTAFRKVDDTHAKVDGELSLMGKTLPVTFDTTLIGAGPGFGKPRLGVEAVTSIDPKAVGLSPMFGDKLEITIDTEFVRE
jgi:polyisoprenoid-binding protein YceI